MFDPHRRLFARAFAVDNGLTSPSTVVQNVPKPRAFHVLPRQGTVERVLCGERPLDQPRTLDYTPAGVLAGGGNPVAGLEAATATLRALYKPGSHKAEVAGLHVVSSFDDALRDAAERSAPIGVRAAAGPVSERDHAWWVRWLAGVRDAWMAVCDGYWCLRRPTPWPVRRRSGLRLASSVVEALKWSACDRFGPEEVLSGAHRPVRLPHRPPRRVTASSAGTSIALAANICVRSPITASIWTRWNSRWASRSATSSISACPSSLDRRAADVPQYVRCSLRRGPSRCVRWASIGMASGGSLLGRRASCLPSFRGSWRARSCPRPSAASRSSTPVQPWSTSACSGHTRRPYVRGVVTCRTPAPTLRAVCTPVLPSSQGSRCRCRETGKWWISVAAGCRSLRPVIPPGLGPTSANCSVFISVTAGAGSSASFVVCGCGRRTRAWASNCSPDRRRWVCSTMVTAVFDGILCDVPAREKPCAFSCLPMLLPLASRFS